MDSTAGWHLNTPLPNTRKQTVRGSPMIAQAVVL
jgi:hypothetical protein